MSSQLSISSLSVPDWVHSKTTKRVVGATAVALLLLWWWRRREFEKKHPPIVLRGTRASATGKVLITGGYLVLEREHTGLVLSVSARFHSTVFPITPHLVHQLQQHTNIALPSIEPQAASQPQQHTYTTHALVYAPQRNKDVTYYTLHYTSGGHFRSERKQGEPSPFVEYTLEITLSLIMTLVPEEEVVDKLKNGILLYLKGDGAFYTSEKETKDQENGIFGKPLPPDSKTGLGSSAALVSSLVAALFAHFGINPCINPSSTSHTYQALTNTTDTHDTQVQLRSSLTLKDQDLVHIAHATAQLCHCVAQGKTGSGFDISAAFYGSQQYKRFTPQHIQPLIARMEAKQHIPAGLLLRYLLPFTTLREVSFASPTKQEALIWDQAVTPLTLPPGLVLVLGDVHGGSKTPDMVKQVLTWRESHNSESERIWTALGHANQQIEQGLRELTNAAEKDKALYDEILQKCAKLQVNEWSSLASPIATKLQSLRSHFQHIRELLVAMGRDAGVEIEPKEQTHLLNQMGDIPGVLFAGVPGAGGSDAIFTIVLSPTVIPLVERVWKSSRLVIHRLHVDADTQPGVIVDRTFQMEGHRWSLFYGNK